MYRPTDPVAKAIRERLDPRQRQMADIMEKVEAYYQITHNDEEVKREIDLVARGASRSSKDGHILLITGESHMGKSSMINHWLDTNEALAPYEIENGNFAYPVFRCKAPSRCDLSGLGREMAWRMGYRTQRKLEESLIFQRVRAQLQIKGIKLVYIDEFQHVVRGPRRKGPEHLVDSLKNMLQEDDWPIHIILSGLPEAAEIYKKDESEQMEGRVVDIAMKPLNYREHGAHIVTMIEDVLEIAGLTSSMPFLDEFVAQLFHGSRNRLGMVFRVLHGAIEDVLDSGGKEVGLDNWIFSYARLAKGGRNVFTDPDWKSIVRGVRWDGTFTDEGEDDVNYPPEGEEE